MTPPKRPMRPSERWSGLAFLAAAALAAYAVVEPLGIPGADPDAGRASPRLPSPVAAGPGDDYFRNPPFDPQRRPLTGLGSIEPPPPAAAAAAAAAVAVEPPLRLAGILGDGGRRRALFQGMQGWQGLGESVRGWRIAELEARRVILRRGDETLVLDASDAFKPFQP